MAEEGGAVVGAAPFWIVSPEIATVPPVIPKMREEALPSTASTPAPGPVMVRFLLTLISPVVSVIVPVRPEANVSCPRRAY